MKIVLPALLCTLLCSAPAAHAAGAVTVASWYQHGRPVTADGTPFSPNNPAIAASRTLPFGTVLEVTNLRNGKTLRVVVHDRGPFEKGRGLDLTRRAAELLGFKNRGLTRVRMVRVPERSFAS